MCLDVMRVMAKEPDTVESIVAYLGEAKGNSKSYARTFDELSSALLNNSITESKGRWISEKLATLTAAKLMMERAPSSISEAYIATRLDPTGRSGAYGTLPDFVNSKQIIKQTVQF